MLCVLCVLSCEAEKPVIHVYDGRGDGKEIALLDKVHYASIVFMKVSCHMTVMLSMNIINLSLVLKVSLVSQQSSNDCKRFNLVI